MADYYTKLSFQLRCQPDEAKRLAAAFNVSSINGELPAELHEAFPPTAEAPDDPLSGFAALFDDPDLMNVGAMIDLVEEGVVIYSEESPDLDAIAELIRRLAPSALPAVFIWIGDCSKPRTDAYAAGYVLIRPEGVQYVDLETLAEAAAASTS